MSKTWNYTPGDWWAYCDVCSKKVKASKMKKRWDGLMVCDEDFETRHPQDFLRTRNDKISVPFARPLAVESFRYTTPWDDDNPPFLNIVSVSDSVVAATTYKRPQNDSVTTADSMRPKATKVVREPVLIGDALTLILTGKLNIGDTAIPASTGDVWLNDYIDRTYFEAAYVTDTARAIT